MPTLTFILSIVVASLVGSLHCAAMCGGLVSFATGAQRSPLDANPKARAPALPQLAYHGARLAAYLTIGISAGALGSAFNLAGASVGLSEVAGLAAGGLMILWGLAVLLPIHTALRPPRLLADAYGRFLAAAGSGSAGARAALLGAASALLPCGWLYAFAVVAAGTGSPWLGTLVMLAFFSGTVPALVGVSLFARQLLSRLGKHAPALSAVMLLSLGLLNVLGRYNVPSTAFAQLSKSGAENAEAPAQFSPNEGRTLAPNPLELATPPRPSLDPGQRPHELPSTDDLPCH